jgi:hypothetical protein
MQAKTAEEERVSQRSLSCVAEMNGQGSSVIQLFGVAAGDHLILVWVFILGF